MCVCRFQICSWFGHATHLDGVSHVTDNAEKLKIADFSLVARISPKLKSDSTYGMCSVHSR